MIKMEEDKEERLTRSESESVVWVGGVKEGWGNLILKEDNLGFLSCRY